MLVREEGVEADGAVGRRFGVRGEGGTELEEREVGDDRRRVVVVVVLVG